MDVWSVATKAVEMRDGNVRGRRVKDELSNGGQRERIVRRDAKEESMDLV